MQAKHDQQITEASKILSIFKEQCILREHVEVILDEQRAVFFTSRFTDHRQDKIGRVDEFGRYVISEDPYEPASYLEKQQYLLLNPLVPQEANTLISKGDQLVIRFYIGNDGYESMVLFEQFLEMHGELAIQVTFPRQINVEHQTREQPRFRTLSNSQVTLLVSVPGIGEFKARLLDLARRGLSFYTELTRDDLPIDAPLTLTLQSPTEEELILKGSVRQLIHLPGSGEEESCNNKVCSVCGVKFVEMNDEQMSRIDGLISLVQREYLIEERLLIQFNKELSDQVQKKTEELRQRDLQLLEMDRITGIGTLAAGIAHEINTPLGFVKSSVNYLNRVMNNITEALTFWDKQDIAASIRQDHKDFLKEKNIDKFLESYENKFDRIGRGIDRIVKIVGSLKNFSRLDMASFGKLNIKRSVEDAIQILSLPDGKYIDFKKKFDEEAPLVECAPNEINQCLLFILQNAIDAVGRDGVIEITTAYDILNDRIHITIIDNGCGMSAETMKHMFDPFFTTKPVGSGTGVGLSITERIIKRHNGTIKVRSKEGEGTTVTMVLPIFGDFAKSN